MFANRKGRELAERGRRAFEGGASALERKATRNSGRDGARADIAEALLGICCMARLVAEAGTIVALEGSHDC